MKMGYESTAVDHAPEALQGYRTVHGWNANIRRQDLSDRTLWSGLLNGNVDVMTLSPERMFIQFTILFIVDFNAPFLI